MIMSGQMLFEWLGHKHDEPKAVEAAQLMERAVERVIAERKTLTPDLGGKASTSQMGDAIAAAVARRARRRVATLRILSAGAAQAVTERIIEAFRRDTGSDVIADFGAVGAMKAKVTAGEPVDVIILTQPMIDELIARGLRAAGLALRSRQGRHRRRRARGHAGAGRVERRRAARSASAPRARSFFPIPRSRPPAKSS